MVNCNPIPRGIFGLFLQSLNLATLIPLLLHCYFNNSFMLFSDSKANLKSKPKEEKSSSSVHSHKIYLKRLLHGKSRQTPNPYSRALYSLKESSYWQTPLSLNNKHISETNMPVENSVAFYQFAPLTDQINPKHRRHNSSRPAPTHKTLRRPGTKQPQLVLKDKQNEIRRVLCLVNSKAPPYCRPQVKHILCKQSSEVQTGE